jgi:nucleotide-binding universal stress UspA family protein
VNPPPRDQVRKWAVGIDGSETAGRALDWATAVAPLVGAELELIRVWNYAYHDLMPASGWTSPSINDDIQAEIEAAMASLVEQTTGSGVPVTATVAVGATADTLLSRAADSDALVVGNRGLGGIGRFVLGSVSQRVATTAATPVIIIPDGCETTGLGNIVVGVDGSASSMQALLWAHELAPAEADIVAVRVWEPYDEAYAELGTRIITEMRAKAHESFEEAVSMTAHDIGLPHRFDAVFDLGRPGERLIDLARDTDLLVVGARGRSGLKAAVLGSTTTWVIHHLTSPTAVMPQT